jgi:uncharacterized membrane protein (UPF0127 family)
MLMITILDKNLKLIKNCGLILIILPLIFGFASKHEMSNQQNQTLTLRLAITQEEHQKGLSGLKPSEFNESEGMLFINKTMGPRRFWMPDTYFNLDIIFLNSKLKIVGLEKNVPFHPGFTEPPAIYRTKEYFAQYILETKAGSQFSKKLKKGDTLKWKSSISLSEIGLKTHPQQ